MCGNTAYDWNTIAMLRSRGGRSETSRSPMRTVPPSMRSSPARQRRSVVLPHPEGPRRTMNSPSRTRRSTSFSAIVLPNTLRTVSNATLAISSPPRSPEIEEVLAHEEDEEERRDDHEETARELEVERGLVEPREDVRGQRSLAHREDRRREHLVPAAHEREDRGGGEARKSERQRDAHERAETRGAQRHRGLFELTRNAVEDTRRHDYNEGQDHRRMDDHDAEERVVQPDADERHRQRDREDRDREHLRRQDREMEHVAAREPEPRQRVAGRRPDREAQDDRAERDDDAVLHRAQYAA